MSDWITFTRLSRTWLTEWPLCGPVLRGHRYLGIEPSPAATRCWHSTAMTVIWFVCAGLRTPAGGVDRQLARSLRRTSSRRSSVDHQHGRTGDDDRCVRGASMPPRISTDWQGSHRLA